MTPTIHDCKPAGEFEWFRFFTSSSTRFPNVQRSESQSAFEQIRCDECGAVLSSRCLGGQATAVALWGGTEWPDVMYFQVPFNFVFSARVAKVFQDLMGDQVTQVPSRIDETGIERAVLRNKPRPEYFGTFPHVEMPSDWKTLGAIAVGTCSSCGRTRYAPDMDRPPIADLVNAPDSPVVRMFGVGVHLLVRSAVVDIAVQEQWSGFRLQPLTQDACVWRPFQLKSKNWRKQPVELWKVYQVGNRAE